MSNAGCEVSQESKINKCSDEIVSLNNRVGDIMSRLRNVNDRLIGSDPRPETNKNDTVEPPGAIGHLELTIASLGSTVTALDAELSRLQDSNAI